jgi:hypothetical protein
MVEDWISSSLHVVYAKAVALYAASVSCPVLSALA